MRIELRYSGGLPIRTIRYSNSRTWSIFHFWGIHISGLELVGFDDWGARIHRDKAGNKLPNKKGGIHIPFTG